jgi:hypothetical protein
MAVLVAVTNHAAERFRQRVGSRTGAIDVKGEIVARVTKAWEAGRISEDPPPGATAARGSVYVQDLVDRAVVFVCRRDRRTGEVLVVTLWEREGGVAPARVPKRFTDVLKPDDQAVAPRRREE